MHEDYDKLEEFERFGNKLFNIRCPNSKEKVKLERIREINLERNRINSKM